jgi:hypothetical protein
MVDDRGAAAGLQRCENLFQVRARTLGIHMMHVHV